MFHVSSFDGLVRGRLARGLVHKCLARGTRSIIPQARRLRTISPAKLQIKTEKERFIVFQCVSRAVTLPESRGRQYLFVLL